MKRSDVVSSIKQIIAEVLLVDTDTITEKTTANDIESWDSIMHVQIILEVENIFGIQFSLSEMENFKNVGDLISSVESKK